MDRTVNVIENLDGKNRNNTRYKIQGKRNINWTDVERYLVEFIGDIYYIAENNNEIWAAVSIPRAKPLTMTKRLSSSLISFWID